MLQLLKDLPDRKWLLIGWLIYQKGLFNPVLEHSRTGLKLLKLLPIEALSLAEIFYQKAASIHLADGCPNPVTN